MDSKNEDVLQRALFLKLTILKPIGDQLGPNLEDGFIDDSSLEDKLELRRAGIHIQIDYSSYFLLSKYYLRPDNSVENIYQYYEGTGRSTIDDDKWSYHETLEIEDMLFYKELIIDIELGLVLNYFSNTTRIQDNKLLHKIEFELRRSGYESVIDRNNGLKSELKIPDFAAYPLVALFVVLLSFVYKKRPRI